MPSVHLAFDLGASSGRAIVGVLEEKPVHLRIEEVHRFEHQAVPTPAGPVWDITGLWGQLLTGLQRAAAWCRERQLSLATVGVDTWGVDWTLIGPGGELAGLPRCYRDPSNEQYSAQVLQQVGGFEKLYARTGIQMLPFNTLFQVAGRLTTEPSLFQPSHRLVFLPDLFHYWFSGQVATESSIASTSAMLDVETGEWDLQLLKQLGIPSEVLAPCVPPGTTLGVLRPELAEAAGLTNVVKVVAPAAHDTASAIAAVPASSADSPRWAYLSSGTWSCMGLELSSPLATPEAAAASFTNERGVGGTFRFLKNIAGLWLVQELRREWNAHGQQLRFEEMVKLASEAPPFRTLVDPNYGEFASPGNMAAKLQAFARRTGQPEPTSPGELVRTCLESLALSYRHTCDKLESLASTSIDLLHVVGGGSQNTLLNQMTADALQRPVVCGPTEATAIGNLLVQATSTGQVKDLPELREIVCRSFTPVRYEPKLDSALQVAAQQRFSALATW